MAESNCAEKKPVDMHDLYVKTPENHSRSNWAAHRVAPVGLVLEQTSCGGVDRHLGYGIVIDHIVCDGAALEILEQVEGHPL